ncbi:hypothetical protein K9N68_15285 [Kovacikia minuta CCNUW1]|uniref:hypothetical protein n=1 Tax=Kovacikia minuta TaxID=2931930 RepID=UPI001CCE6434|nr:hypothetical protein [Kovacikia minuta]UBF29074.1 hypothetical protein K9N68_15285 [Kovacikia minuta CCNUW1]
MTLQDLQAWAQAQIDNTAQPAVNPEVGISVLQMVDELEHLQAYVQELEAKLATAGQRAS